MTEPTRAPIEFPVLNYFRFEQLFDGLHFASVESGDWLFLTKQELEEIRTDCIPSTLRDRLVRSGFLLEEGNIDEYCRRLRSRYGFLSEGPTLHILVMTRKCNLRCIYCQASSGTDQAGQMDVATARAAVDRALETPAPSLVLEFQGGEPLIAFAAIRAAISRAEERAAVLGKKVSFSLTSNFTEVVTEDVLRFLLEHRVSVCASLDGPCALHDHNRGRTGCFDRVRANLELYRRLWQVTRQGPPVLRALLTTTRPSLSEARAIIDVYDECGINLLSIRPLTPVGRARDSRDDLTYGGEEFLEFWTQIVDEVLSRRRQGARVSESHLELLLLKLFAGESGYMDLRSPCGAGIGQIVYDVDGAIYTCDEGRMVVGDRFRIGHIAEPLREALASPRTRAVLDASIAEQYFCDFCALKPFCGVCPVMHSLDTGEMHADPLAQRRCAVFGGMLRHILRLFATDAETRRTFGDIVEAAWS